MKKNILIKGGGFASIVLYELLKNVGYNVDFQIGNNIFENTFISFGFFNKIKNLFSTCDCNEYESYYFINGELKKGEKLIFLGDLFFSKYENIKDLEKEYDYEFIGTQQEQLRYNEKYFGKLKFFKIKIKNFKKYFALEFYNIDGVPSYFYHIGGNNYLFGYYTFSIKNDIKFLLTVILKNNLFKNYFNRKLESYNYLGTYDIKYSLVKKNLLNNLYIGNNLGILPPFLGIGNKLVFIDSLFIVDFVKKGYNINKLFENLYNFRKVFFIKSQLIGLYIKNNGNKNYYKIKTISSAINKDLDKIINFFIKNDFR